MPSPTPTPQLSKEYIRTSGGRLLAVEDKNAIGQPPADLAIWRPGTQGVWWIFNPATGSTWATVDWGITDDEPIPGDYDGDGTTDCAVRRDGSPYATWYVFYSASGPGSFQFGVNTDLPAQADYDGDGKTDRPFIDRRLAGNLRGLVRSGNDRRLLFAEGVKRVTSLIRRYDGDGWQLCGLFVHAAARSFDHSSNAYRYYASGISPALRLETAIQTTTATQSRLPVFDRMHRTGTSAQR